MASYFASLLPSWLRSSRTSRSGRGAPRVPRKAGVRLAVEALEDRMLMTAGALDPTFGVGGLVHTNFSQPSEDKANAVAITPEGKIVVAGSSYPYQQGATA